MLVMQFVALAHPSREHRRFHEWQTFQICILIGDKDPNRAFERARNRLKRERFNLIRVEGQNIFVEELVREAGGAVWKSFQALRESGGIEFRAWPLEPMTGEKSDPATPIAPRITEDFIDAIIVAAGGHRLTDEEANHEQTKNADYLIGNLVLELKILEEEGLRKKTRQVKVGELLSDGEFGDGVESIAISEHSVTPEQRRKFLDLLGRPIKSAVGSASKQIRATKEHLSRPDLRGGVIIVNSGYKSLRPETFGALVARYVEKDTTQIDEFICISTWMNSNGMDSNVFFEFVPHKEGCQEIQDLRSAFQDRVNHVMTEFMRNALRYNGETLQPVGPIAFEHHGFQMVYEPPRMPPFPSKAEE